MLRPARCLIAKTMLSSIRKGSHAGSHNSRCAAEASYAPWGSYDIAFAAPEVVSAALSIGQLVSDTDPSIVEGAEGVSAAADVWSLGMLLFYAAAGAPYWPRSYGRLDILHCLLGHSSMPHEANPHMLDAAGTLAPVVARMISRSAEIRPSILDVGEFAANGVCEAVMGLMSQDVRSHMPLQCVPGSAPHQPCFCKGSCAAELSMSLHTQQESWLKPCVVTVATQGQR